MLDSTNALINGLNLYCYCLNNPINTADNGGNMPNWLKWLLGGLAFVAAVALTVVTGGALAPVFIGMGVSVVAGGLISGTISAVNGGGFWDGFKDGAADGALWGGVFALGGAALRTVKLFKNGIVIGESMKRVNAAAKSIGAVTYKAPGKGIVKIFGKETAYNMNMSLNRSWINRMTRLGVKISDIGFDIMRSATSRSPFYQMESEALVGYINRIIKFW